MDEFERELIQLINKYSLENESNTPDFILAKFLLEAFYHFNDAVRARTNWYKP